MWNNQGGDGGYEQGGGFQSPGGGGFGSPSASQGEKKARATNIIPCTVAQVLNAAQEGDKFVVDGIEIHQVTLVGLVRSVNVTPTRLDYTIDDNTGPAIDVKQFVDNDENVPDNERTQPMREDTYIRIYGNVRHFQNKRSVAAFKVLPVTDMNEVTCHILESMKVHLELTQMAAGGDNTSAMQQGENHATPAKNTYAGANPADSSMSNIQQQVLSTIQRVPSNDEEGISIQSIMQQLRGLPEKALRDAVEFLSGEGHIFSTIDDDHYRSTDAD